MSKEPTIHMGIGFVTGRRSFLKVLKTYIYNWHESGMTDMHRVKLHVFIAYDLQYNKTKPDDFTRVSDKLSAKVDSIEFIDASYLQDQIDDLQKHGIAAKPEAELFFASGYAAMRNAVLYAAVKRRMDYLLFLDDDEYPLTVTKSGPVAIWSGQHLLAQHLQHIANADITNGYHCGYISPIPSIHFNDTLTEEDFRVFVEAISNDIISWERISTIMRQGGVTYADTGILTNQTVTEVTEIKHCKFISGSNLCINLTKPHRVFPFFNPPGARGEDTFLSTCLAERRVVRIPSYAFHNGFSTYNYLLSGVLPTELVPITASMPTVIDRFYRACVGWVRYKPLFLYITRRVEYDSLIQDMRQKLQYVLPKFEAYFHKHKFGRILSELDQYDRDVKQHYELFVNNQAIWQKMVSFLDSQYTGKHAK